jgi:hypothetical protein
MSSINNNDNDMDDDTINWRVFSGRKPETPLQKAKVTVKDNAEKIAVDMDTGGLNAKVNSGTIVVRFMIDPKRHREFNLCLRLREFIMEARSMDVTFRILPLDEDGGESVG